MAEARAGNFIWMEEFEKDTFIVEAQILESPNGCYIRRQLTNEMEFWRPAKAEFQIFQSNPTASTKCNL